MCNILYFLPEAGGLYFRRYQNFITSVIGIIIIISPPSNPRTMNSVGLCRSISVDSFDEGEGALTYWVVCDIVGAL